MSLYRLLRGQLAPYRRLLWLVVVLQAVQTTATLALPALTADLINDGVLPGVTATIWRVGLVMVGFSVVQLLFAGAAVWYGARVAMGFGRDVRAALFQQVTSFSSREVADLGAASLITRITNDVQQIQQIVVMGTTMMMAAPITMVIGLVLALREDVGLSVVVLTAIPLVVLMLGVVIRQLVPGFQLMQEQIDGVNGVLREQLLGLRVVRAFVREPEETARFADANGMLTATSLRVGRLMAFMFPSMMLISNGASIAVLALGASRVEAGTLQVGSLIAYLTYLVMILMAVIMTTFMLSMLPRASVAAERVLEVLETEPSVRPPVAAVHEVDRQADLEFRDVGFTYEGARRAVLDEVSFHLRRGRTVAVIGSTGSGKTTLVNLVSRLFDVTEGTVLVNGVDVRELDPDLLWRTVALVPQKAHLFSGTVASNLRFGNPDATDAELWDALEIAQADGFVQSMPDGLESPITQGGTNVSGGQRQRLSIARALVAKPEILVLDDAFSALDLATEARLRAALRPRIGEMGVLLVSQRVATIRNADEILVLEDGEVVGRGPHDDLVARCATYREIVDSQTERSAVA